jgi:hypothetical protein
MPSIEENTRIAKEFIEKVFSQHDVGYLKDALSEDFVDLSPVPGMPSDKAGRSPGSSRYSRTCPTCTAR